MDGQKDGWTWIAFYPLLYTVVQRICKLSRNYTEVNRFESWFAQLSR